MQQVDSQSQQQQQQKRYYSNFINSVRSEATRRSYQHYLKKFQEFYEGKDILFDGNIKQIEQNIITYLLSIKEKGLSHHHIKCTFVGINHFYMINDINLNRNKIKRFIHFDEKKKHKNQGYSSEQIQRLLDICDERTKVIILVYASTGIRLGALPELKVGDLELIDVDLGKFQLYKITVYQGYNEEYISFCTPECTKVINSYLEYRQRFGEKITNDSPLIREQFNPDDPLKAKYPKSITIQTIAKTLTKKLVQNGIRIVKQTGKGEYSGARFRKDIPLIHGFRKFFNTALMNADIHPVFKELLMGHSVKLDDFYYDKTSKKSKQKLLEEYTKAIDNLTISEENRLRIKLSTAEDVQTQLEHKDERIYRLEQQAVEMHKKTVEMHKKMKAFTDQMTNKIKNCTNQINNLTNEV